MILNHQASLHHLRLTLFLLLILTNSASSENFKVGYLTGSQRRRGDHGYSRPGHSISGAISLAVDEINSLQPLVGNNTLGFIVAETYGDESESIRQTARLWTEAKVSAYIGPQETCVHEARMASSFNLPMISYFCAHPETSNKALFPTFARTRPPDTQISKSVASVLLKFNWKKIALLYSKSEPGFRNFEAVANTIQRTLVSYDIEVRFVGKWTTTYHYGFTNNPFRDLVERSYTEARIYVVVGHYFEHLGFMLCLEEKGLLTSGNYFVVGVDVEQYDMDRPTRYFKGLFRDEVDKVAQSAFQSYIGVVASPSYGSEDFFVKVNKYMQLSPFNFENPLHSEGGLKRVPAEGAYLYDAVYVYARALNDTIIDNKNPLDGRVIFSYIKDRPYKSAMGYMVYMDENGDAAGNYTLISRRKPPGKKSQLGMYPTGMFEMPDNSSHLPVLNLFESIEWINSQPPLDEPICGFHGEKCSDAPLKWLFALIGTVVFVLSILLMAVYRSWVYEQELDSLLWRVESKDITLSDIPLHVEKSKHSSQVSLSSETDIDEHLNTNVFTQVGLYKGRLVAVKIINLKHIEITRKLKKEMKIMRDIRHDNLNTFVGASISSPHFCLLTDYCERGSIKDVLKDEKVKIDHIFAASMISDIIRGMIYLHESPLGCHGNLTSYNCLVDRRWVVKINGFGFYALKAESYSPQDVEDVDKECEKLQYRSPEMLRNPVAYPRGSQKSDVYSFGVIFYEILGKKGPWGEINMRPSEIVSRVMHTKFGNQPFRPSLAQLSVATATIIHGRDTDNHIQTRNIFDCCLQCMKACWAENPDERPDFKALRARLRLLRSELKGNIMDNILQLMERYSNNLEREVEKKAFDIIEEKKKTDALLYQMMPKAVADQLKMNGKVDPESYEMATVFFSDIVGFTSMSARSTPLDIVTLLNDLYTLFDSILENYDVYKVETIGDAYMVCSGVPVRNGDSHAAEIASMALDLLEKVKRFRIVHLENEKLLMRIGIHSGPVCTGIVGTRMPRYCLFGDTVNTASRMEATCLPLKIHCSEDTKKVLDKCGGYETEDRGMISVKGKGEMKTYWLIGEIERRKSRRKTMSVSSCRRHQEMTPRTYSQGHTSMTPIKDRFAGNTLKDFLKKYSADEHKRQHLMPKKSNKNGTLNVNKASSTARSFIDVQENNLSEPFQSGIKPARSQTSINVSLTTPSLSFTYKEITNGEETLKLPTETPTQISVNITSSDNKIHVNRLYNDDSLSERLKCSLKDVLLQRVASFPSSLQKKILRSESVPFLQPSHQ